MDLSDIQNREDVKLLVTTFYDIIRKDEKIGPIFNKAIQDWDSHLIHLTNL